MKNILAEAQRLHFLRAIDVQFAQMIATPDDPALMLASACLSAAFGVGHVCLPLMLLTPEMLFEGRIPLLAKEAWIKAGKLSINEWHQYLLTSNAVSNGCYSTPLVLDNQCLYLHRMWQYECVVAKFFYQSRPLIIRNESVLLKMIERYFPKCNGKIDWQRIAVVVAITYQISLILIRSGTEKVSVLSKLIAILLHLYDDSNIRILVVTPNSRVSSYLTESMLVALEKLDLDEKKKKQLPRLVTTIHSLLGVKSNRREMKFNPKNQIDVDILIVDESSMIDLVMMANIITVLPPQAQIIFFGDHFQLPSVEAGAVLSDICQCAEGGYSISRHAELVRLTGYNNLPVNKSNKNYTISDSMCFLNKNYPPTESSKISRLANAISSGNEKKVTMSFSLKKEKDIVYIPMYNNTNYQSMIKDCISNYTDYLEQIDHCVDISRILNSFHQFRLFCVLKESYYGVSGLNENIELVLNKMGLIDFDDKTRLSYLGRPIVIVCDSLSLGLHKGDIGILLRDDTQKLRAYFSLPNGEIKGVPLIRLPKHKTAFAMTVSKSQGLEFQNIALVLPDQILPVLTRELLYTALTCARKRFFLYATEEVFKHTIKTKSHRYSGLVDRLKFQ